MFERYTEGARKSIFYAREEALKRGASSIAPGHLLLGMLRAEPEIIQRLSPSPASGVSDLQRELDAVIPSENEKARLEEIPLLVETKNVLYAAYLSSEAMRHRHIGVEHLLLGLFGEEQHFGRSAGGKFDVQRFLSERGFNKEMIEGKIRGDLEGA